MSYLCDFCNSTIESLRDGVTVKGNEVNATIRASMGEIVISHDADWLACPVCARLIEAQGWEALLMRVCVSAGVQDPIYDLLMRVTYSKAFNIPGLVQRSPLLLHASNHSAYSVFG